MAWNLRSLNNKSDKDKLENFLHVLTDNDISIACITETWFDAESGTFSKSIKDSGYNLFHSFRDDQRGGGTAIMCKMYNQVLQNLNLSNTLMHFLKNPMIHVEY